MLRMLAALSIRARILQGCQRCSLIVPIEGRSSVWCICTSSTVKLLRNHVLANLSCAQILHRPGICSTPMPQGTRGSKGTPEVMLQPEFRRFTYLTILAVLYESAWGLSFGDNAETCTRLAGAKNPAFSGSRARSTCCVRNGFEVEVSY